MKALSYSFLLIISVFILYFFVQYTLYAVTTQPQEGDSVKYHIPIAHSILGGTFIDPSQITEYGPDNVLHFYPSMGEVILALFILGSIPLNLYNIIGTLILAMIVYLFSMQVGLYKLSSLWITAGIVTMVGISRWAFSQVIDIYLLIFYLSLVLLLMKPFSSRYYFLLLGVVTGFLIGIKFTGIFLAFFAYLIFFRSKFFSSTRSICAWGIPIIVLGLSWYLRNYLLAGNPFFPQSFLWFPGLDSWNILKIQVWEMIIATPGDMLNAYISEYGIFSLSILIVPVLLLLSSHKRSERYQLYLRIGVLSLCNFVFFLLLVTSTDYNVKVSSFRYSYPVFIPLIVLSARLLEEFKQEGIVMVAVIINVVGSLAFEYHPKYFFFVLVPFIIYMLYKQHITHDHKK